MSAPVAKRVKREPAYDTRKREKSVGDAPIGPRGPSPDEIRVRAYHLWAYAGKPPGDGVSFWLEAERELHESLAGGRGRSEGRQ